MLSCLVYGLTLPSGLFIPSLVCGATYGRFIGEVMESLGNDQSCYQYVLYDIWVLWPGGFHAGTAGMYALIGGAAFLTGPWHCSVYPAALSGLYRNVSDHHLTNSDPH